MDYQSESQQASGRSSAKESTGKQKQEQQEVPTELCASCYEHKPFNDGMAPGCEHAFCRECAESMLRQACDDEAWFPVRCCGRQVVLTGRAWEAMDGTLVSAYFSKAEEFAAVDKVYCSRPACSVFLRDAGGGVGTTAAEETTWKCAKCGAETCAACRGAAHAESSKKCPKDGALKKIAKLARKHGWKKCKCGRLIEKDRGCDHITCQCGHEFCYRCGAAWTACACGSRARWLASMARHI